MKSFDDIEVEDKTEAPKLDRYQIQKQRLLFNLTRSDKICSAIGKWLNSFDGGMSREAFMKQVLKLDFNDEIALQQLDKSYGKRCIQKKSLNKSSLPQAEDVVTLLARGDLFIAINGVDRAIRNYVRTSYQTLKTMGRAYVVDLNELKLMWTDKYNRGSSQEILTQARDAEFLFIVGLEAPLDLAPYIHDWLNSIRRYRIENGLPMIVPFARFREETIFFEYFKKFSVKIVDKG